MLKQHEEEVFVELEAAGELSVYLVSGVQEEEEGGAVVAVAVGGGGVAGAGVARGERVTCLYPLPLYQGLEPVEEEGECVQLCHIENIYIIN